MVALGPWASPLEDKIVQKAAAMILTAMYEQAFLDCSYGYRPNKGAKDAVCDLTFQLQFGVFGYIVEADIKGYFDNIDRDKLLGMLEKRIDDRAFLRLIAKWLKAGILEPDGYVKHPVTGTPQGGPVSPVLSNIYLHVVLDEWFEDVVKPRLKGRAVMCRYADDWVCAFQYRDDARRFYNVLPKHQFFKTLEKKLIGHYNYYYVHGNARSVWAFYRLALGYAKKWLNRRSQRKSYTWEKFKRVLEYTGVPRPRPTEKKRLHQCSLR